MKKKGFTLIELLAVIVILAVIALIAMPIVLNTIETAKKGAAKSSATSYIKAFENKLVSEMIFNNKNAYEGIYTLNQEGNIILPVELNIDVKYDKATKGKICVTDGKVKSYSLKIGNYYVTSTNGIEQKITNEIENINCVSLKQITPEITIDNNNCSKTKKISIIYPGIDNAINQYKLGDGEWEVYTDSIVITNAQTIYARIMIEEEYSNEAILTVTKVDNQKVNTVEPKLELSQENPRTSIVVYQQQNDECELDKSTIEYGYSTNASGTYTWQASNILQNLSADVTYYVKTRANDIAGNGVVESEPATITTIPWNQISITSDIEEWSTSKTITITGNSQDIILQYQIGSNNSNGWLEYTKPIIVDKNTIIYARLYDGYTYSSEKTLKITTIDTTKPSLTIDDIVTSLNGANIKYSASDSESDIKSTICEYGLTNSFGKSVTGVDGTCTLKGLNGNATYYLKVTTTNGAGITNAIESTFTTYLYETNGLVTRYNLNSSSNTSSTLTNLSGTSYNGIINGAQFKNGGLYFDGNDWVKLGQINTPRITYEVLVKKEGSGHILSNLETGGCCIYSTGSKMRGQCRIGGTYRTLDSTKTFSNTEYVSVAITYDQSTFKLYINGELDKQYSNSSGLNYPGSSTPLVLGGNPYGNTIEGEYYKGYIYAIRIYNRALTASEIKHNYASDKETYNID